MALNRSTLFANLAGWDRVCRLVIGGLALAAGWWMNLPAPLGLALRILGWAPVLTGVLGWSPLYSLLDITTRPHPYPGETKV